MPAGKHTLRYSVRRELRIRGKGYWVERRNYNTGNMERAYYVADPNALYVPYEIICEVTYDFKKGGVYEIYADERIFYSYGEVSAPKGTEIRFKENEKKQITSITFIPNVNVEETSVSNGNVFVKPESSGHFGAGWSYGGVSVGQIGERFGFGFLGGKTDIKLVGIGQIGTLFFSNDNEDKSLFGLHYNFGGLLEYHFPYVGIGLGGGMFGRFLKLDKREENFTVISKERWEHYGLQPYLELNMSIRGRGNYNGWQHHVIYFQYYPTLGEEWYNTYGFGYKTYVYVR
jgi:hypothetical protein